MSRGTSWRIDGLMISVSIKLHIHESSSQGPYKPLSVAVGPTLKKIATIPHVCCLATLRVRAASFFWYRIKKCILRIELLNFILWKKIS